MPSYAALETQRKRRLDEPQCEVKGCQGLVAWIIETQNGAKHLACWGHASQIALKYSCENDCLMVLP